MASHWHVNEFSRANGEKASHLADRMRRLMAKVYFVEGIKAYWILCSNRRECWKEWWKLSVLRASFAKEMSEYRLQFTPLQDSPLDCSTAVPGVILIQADINTRTSFMTNKSFISSNFFWASSSCRFLRWSLGQHSIFHFLPRLSRGHNKLLTNDLWEYPPAEGQSPLSFSAIVPAL